jgi:hypothetical protein
MLADNPRRSNLLALAGQIPPQDQESCEAGGEAASASEAVDIRNGFSRVLVLEDRLQVTFA